MSDYVMIANTRYHDAVETIPRAELERLQEDKLLAVLPYVYERSALVRATWDEAGVRPRDIESVADFRKLVPFISKDALRRFRDEHDDPFGGVLCVPADELTAVVSTSGTTGDPTLMPQLWDYRPYPRHLPRYFHEMGLAPGDFAVAMTPKTRGPYDRALREFGAVPIMFDHAESEISRLVELSRRCRPTFLYMLSVPMIHWLREFECSRGEDLREAFSSYRSVVFGGEPLSPADRDIVARWGIDLFEVSSVGDVSVAFDCGEHAGMHAYEDLVLLEHLRAGSDEPVRDGEPGELVVTALDDRAGPLVRFRTEDMVRLTREPCRCGRTHARFTVSGRLGDQVVVHGVAVFPLAVRAVVETIEATSAGLLQIIRPAGADMAVLRLRVGYAGNPDLADLSRRVAESVRAEVGVETEIELVGNEELLKLGPPHKIPRVAKR